MDTTIPMDIVRASPVGVRLSRGDGSEMPVMSVRFAPFNVWYTVRSWWEGDFIERIAPGAFKKTMQESGARMKIMFQHGHDFHVGEKLLGLPENLREEDDSPVVDVRLFDTSYNRDLLPGIEAGAYGSSFMFYPTKWDLEKEPERSDYNPEGLPEKTLREVRLLEAGPVTWPANPEATSGLRSMTDQYYEGLRSRDARRVEQLELRVRSLRTSPAPQSPEGTAEQEAAPQHDPIEPLVTQHSGGGMSPRERRERLYPHLRSKANDDRGDAVAA